MERRESASRMVAFLVLLYAVYLLALIVFGVLLRTGVLSGEAPAGLTIVPAAVAGVVVAAGRPDGLLPGRLRAAVRIGRGQRPPSPDYPPPRRPSRPRSPDGTRTAVTFLREPQRGGLAMLGAAGFWAANIGVLWASFHAYGVTVPLGVVVQGFFVGMAANLFPSPRAASAPSTPA